MEKQNRITGIGAIMKESRRKFIKTGAAVGGLATFAAGYSGTAKHALDGVLNGTSGVQTKNRIFGNALQPEFIIDTQGAVQVNPKQRLAASMCFGCWTKCGVRLRIDNETEKVLRISGNPYHPLAAEEQIPYKTTVEQSLLGVSGKDEIGLGGRSTVCARGNAMLEQLSSPYRIKTPLKRVGERGSGKWEPISFEQLIKEVVHGGDLFNEGHVDGLKAIRDLKTPLDPKNPEYGPKANQLLMSNAGDDGRTAFFKRFTFNSFGTRNFGHHGAYCGFSMRAASGALMNDLKKYAHVKPDWSHVDFGLFIGSSPAQSGNPFQRQARQLAKARTERDFEYIVVSPVLPNSSNLASQPNNNWVPVKPGSDAGLVMGMIRWIIENKRYDANFLAQPGPKAAQAADEAQWSNGTHLVISDETHPRYGAFLRSSDVGKAFKGKAYGKGDAFMVVEADSKQLVANNKSAEAVIFVSREVETSKGSVLVKSSMQRLKEEAERFSLKEYSEVCGIAEATIIGLADKFTSYGKRAVVDVHGGMMSSNGFYTAYGALMLNALVGNYNVKGGVSSTGGKFPEFGGGPRYNFKKFPGKVKPKGVFLSRSRFPYQKTTEYKSKVAAGKNPYPSQQPWYPFSPPIMTEHLSSALDGYPYPIKAMIFNMSNPIYGQAGLKTLIEKKLKDPTNIPLFIAIDAFINETTAFADYVVPDTITYESWGWTSAWSGTVTKLSTARWPAVEPATDKTPKGEAICMESFLIAVAKEMKLPGFGDKAIPDNEGNLGALNKVSDFYLKAAANVAYFKGKAVPDASAKDIELSGLDRLQTNIKQTLKPAEQAKVAYMLARGGRFEDADKAYVGKELKHKYGKNLCIWNEKVGTSINTLSGKHYVGCPTYYPQQLADGTPLDKIYPPSKWPFLLSSFKSHVQSSCSITSERLRSVHSHNPVSINREDAKRMGINNGDKIRITTPGGSAIAVALVRNGVFRGTIGIEHGFGHKELGARAHLIGDQRQPEAPEIGAGINLNDIGLIDPHRNGSATLLDWVSGGSARQGLPASIEKIS